MQNDDNSKRVMGYVHARELSYQEISQVSGGDDEGGEGGDKGHRTKVTVGTGGNTTSTRSDH